MRSTWTGFTGGTEVIGTKVRDSPSGLAVLVKIEEIDLEKIEPPKAKWIPYSQIEAGSYNKNTSEYKMILTDWFARKLHEELSE
jgi:hypothetical protein